MEGGFERRLLLRCGCVDLEERNWADLSLVSEWVSYGHGNMQTKAADEQMQRTRAGPRQVRMIK